MSTLVFIGSLLATSLEKVHSDNNEVSQQHRRRDEEVANINDIIGETSNGSIRASRRSGGDTDEDVEPSDEEIGMRAGRRNDRNKEGDKADVSDENTKKKKKKQESSNRTDGGADKSSAEEESDNRRSGNKRGSDETDKSDGKRGGDKTSEHDGNDRKRGERGGRNADNNEASQENNDGKRGGRGGGGGGGRAGEEDKEEKANDQQNERKKNKRGNRDDESASGNEKKHGNKKKKLLKEGRKFRKRLDQENHQVTHSAGVVLVAPAELVAGVPSSTEAEVEHEMMSEGHVKAKSEKESVHQDAPSGITLESAHTVETLHTVTGDATSKRKKRYEKPDRRRNHPRPPEHPTPPQYPARGSDATSSGRFVVPTAAKQKQRSPGRQRQGGKTGKMTP